MKYFKSQKGLSLVELMIALIILTFAVLSLMPLFEYMTKAASNNRFQSEAAELAASELDRIRSLPYDSIGIAGGNPSGPLSASEPYVVNGTRYEVQRNIWWEDDPSDNNPTDAAPYDYKKIQIRVKALSAVSKNQQTVTVYTKICREGGQVLLNGGGLNVLAVRSDGTTPVKDVSIDLGSANLSTDGEGHALFLGVDPPGDYQLRVNDPGPMIVQPNLKIQNVAIVNKIVNSRQILVDYPGWLAITFNPMPTSGTINLIAPYSGGDQTITITESTPNPVVFPQLWPGAWGVELRSASGAVIGTVSPPPIIEPNLTTSVTL